MPCGSRIRIAYSRQVVLTGQAAHSWRAAFSRASFSGLRSKWLGGKKKDDRLALHWASARQSSTSTDWNAVSIGNIRPMRTALPPGSGSLYGDRRVAPPKGCSPDGIRYPFVTGPATTLD